MQTLYKLTDMDGYTQNSTKWEEGTIHKLEYVENPQLCSSDVFHVYTDLTLGLLLNPIHAAISLPRLWECLGFTVVADWGKAGVFELEIVKELGLPEWYEDRAVRRVVQLQFAILCAHAVLHFYEQEKNDSTLREALEEAEKYLDDNIPEDIESILFHYNTVLEEAERFSNSSSFRNAARSAYNALATIIEYDRGYSLISAERAADAAYYAVMADAALDIAELADKAVQMVMEKE